MSDNLNNDFTTSVSGVDVASGRKTGKKVALISGIAVVALGLGGIAAYNFSGLVKNQVNLKVMKPAKYYAWVNEENAQALAKDAKEKYAQSLDRIKGGQTSDISLKYVANDTVKDLALQSILGADYQSAQDDESKMLIDAVNNINDISLDYKTSVKGSNVYANVSALLNSDTLADLNMAVDVSSLDYFFRVPQLTEQWLGVALNDSILQEADEETTAVLKSYQEFLANPESFLSPDQLEDLIIRYTGIWNENVKDIEVESKEDINICDISVNYTVMTAELNRDVLNSLAESYVNELKNDNTIKGILIDKTSAISEDEYNSALDEVLDAVKNSGLDEDYTIKVQTYVDSEGAIKGGRIKAPMAGEVFFAYGENGNDVRCEFRVAEQDNEIASVKEVLQKDGNKYSGNIEATVNENGENTRVTVDVENMEIVNEDMGYLNGSYIVNVPDVDPIKIEFSSDGNSQDIKYNLNFDGTDYGSLILSLSVQDGASAEVPDKNSAYMIDVENPDFDVNSYIPEENMEKFVTDLLVKVGISEELSKEASKALTQEIYSEVENEVENIEDYVY